LCTMNISNIVQGV